MIGTVVLHAGRSTLPVSHWSVLVLSVFGVWLLIGCGTLAADRVFD